MSIDQEFSFTNKNNTQSQSLKNVTIECLATDVNLLNIHPHKSHEFLSASIDSWKRGGGISSRFAKLPAPVVIADWILSVLFFIDRLLTANETATINDVSCHLFHLFLALAKLPPSQSLFASLARNVRLFHSIFRFGFDRRLVLLTRNLWRKISYQLSDFCANFLFLCLPDIRSFGSFQSDAVIINVSPVMGNA